MSERDRTGSPFVTPTFQAVLNFNILGVMEALNANAYHAAYNRITTLIYSLKPEHQKPLLDNDVAHIQNRVKEILQKESVDLYQTRWRQSKAVRKVLANKLPNLFQKVMAVLHREGYLEKKPVQPRAKGKGRLRIE